MFESWMRHWLSTSKAVWDKVEYETSQEGAPILNVSRQFRACVVNCAYVAAAAVAILTLAGIATGRENAPPTIKYTNHLIHEKSPYLLLHAHNPVDWYPWGEEAFAKARRQNKPIFLSVGYYVPLVPRHGARVVFE